MRFCEVKPGIVRIFGISLLIASVVHIPLPQPDFHNIRHHDGPGEVCTYHDHLLRWHPSAKHGTDASVLHWHWVLPSYDGLSDELDGSDNGSPRPGFGLVYHAAVGDGLDSGWSNAQWLSADRMVVTLEAATPSISVPVLNVQYTSILAAHPPAIGFDRASAMTHAQLTLRPRLQRWNC